MKTSLFIFVSFFLFSFSSLSAQSLEAYGVRVGTHFGKSPVFLDGKSIDEDEVPIRGFELAFPLRFSISNSFSFQPEISLTQKGSRYAEEEKDGSYFYKSSISLLERYLEIPLLLKWHYHFGSNSIFIQSGVAPSYLLKAKLKEREVEEYDNEREVTKTRTKIEIKDEFVRFDLGVLVGFGFERKFDFGSLFFDVRYNHGLLNQEDDLPEFEEDAIKLFHRGTSFTIGFFRPLNQSVDAQN